MSRELYRAHQLPVFQNRMFRTEAEAIACPRGDIVLVQDSNTGLIYNAAFQPEQIQYDADYQNEQAISSVFRTHLDEITSIIHRHFRGCNLIEIGCGKAYFLEHLQKLGFAIIGVDPAYEGNNPNVIKAHFNRDVGLRADGIMLRHVLEHIPQPIDFLHELRTGNGGGKLYIEVPCFDWICRHRAWFDVFYEHVNYFRLDDFKRLFERILDIGHIFGGQYFYVVADLASLRDVVSFQKGYFTFPQDFTASIERFADRIRTRNVPAVVWGGASKGVIFSLFMQRASAKIHFVVDINPAKQGRFLPATGLRVSSPEEMLAQIKSEADIYVMNGNYIEEIRRMTQNKFNYLMVDHD